MIKSYNGILCKNENEFAALKDSDKAPRYNTEQKKPDMKVILCDSVYMVSPNRQNLSMVINIKRVVAFGEGFNDWERLQKGVLGYR